MKLKGSVEKGPHRGWEMIGIYLPRLKHLLGFEPFRGTLDIKLEKPVDLKLYSNKKIEHKLINGKPCVYAYLAPVILEFHDKNDPEKTIRHECWAIRQMRNVYKDDVVEIIDKENLKEKFGLKNGDSVEVEFFKQPLNKRTVGKRIRDSFMKR